MAAGMNVTLEDQQKINRFSRLNKDFHEHEKDVKSFEEKLHSYEDALDEVELACEDRTTIMIGESFVSLTEAEALDRMQKLKADCVEGLGKAREDLESCVKEMEELKVHLYAKFGNMINLEE
jgi:prefoldin subunit 4